MQKIFSQSDCSSLFKYALNLSNIEIERGTYVPSITSKFHQNPTIPKLSNQIAAASLNMHGRNLSNIEFERGAYVPSITSKFHQNPTIPFQDIVWKAKRTDRQTDKVITIEHPHLDAGP
jgi:hypothetical protein